MTRAVRPGERHYDTIGVGYARFRQPDPRIAAAIDSALGAARTVVDVGSGTGSYEPRGRTTTAVEPSQVMIEQRPVGAAPVVRAVAEHLPFADRSFDASLAVLTVHHWPDHLAGLRELTRVSELQVVLTWDPDVTARFWLVDEYLPEIITNEVHLPTLRAITSALDVAEVRPVLVPADCTDGFCGAYWKRPEMYLDEGARAAISAFSHCDPDNLASALVRLRADIETGRWAAAHTALDSLAELDLGYRVVVARGLA